MKPMQEYAIEKVREGGTTLEEVLRVIPFEPDLRFSLRTV